MAISETDLLKMVRLCMDQPYTVRQLERLLNIPYSTIYNFLGTNKGKFYFKSEKTDGLRFFRTVAQNCHLIKGEAKLKPTPKSATGAYAKIDENPKNQKIGGRISWERRQAIRKVQTINGFGQSEIVRDKNGNPVYNKETKKAMRRFTFFSDYHEKVYNDCLDLFYEYRNKTDNMELIFTPVEGLFGEAITKPYATRFNSTSKQIDLRKTYEGAWEGGEKLYKIASFVTLTTDPKQFTNLWEANKHFQTNWNKLITRLRKSTGKSLPYICVREFQKNGRVHFHIAIFGHHLPETSDEKKYNHEISKIWNEYGQGKITDVKQLEYQNGAFQWLKGKPQDCKKDESPMNYLKKYLIKAQYDETAQFQYWVYNARFYTYSQSLYTKPKQPKRPPIYEYQGTINTNSGEFYRKSIPKRHYARYAPIQKDTLNKYEIMAKQNTSAETHFITAHELSIIEPMKPKRPQKEETPPGFMINLYMETRAKSRRKKMY